ncbi:hypothetical protein [Nonomuraea sp. NPDC003214]
MRGLMGGTSKNEIVLAYGGSDFSMQALDEAERRKVPLIVTHAWQWPYGQAADVAASHLRKAIPFGYLCSGIRDRRGRPVPASRRRPRRLREPLSACMKSAGQQ